MTVLHNWKSSGTWLADHRQVQPWPQKGQSEHPHCKHVQSHDSVSSHVRQTSRKKIKAEN